MTKSNQSKGFPNPVPALVIRYAYLWRREHVRGIEEGSKDRPCSVILVTTESDKSQVVTVLPITHTPPNDPAFAVEIPTATKKRLGLDDDRSWIVVTEANRFTWPGPDLRPTRAGGAASVAYGLLPEALFKEVQTKFLKAIKKHRAMVKRSQ
ncbi:MAG: hypothetical protein WCD70_08995 [Alphaproteobacteria bacterium]